MRYAFSQAAKRRGHVTSATKSNGIPHSMTFWDDVFKEVSQSYPDIRTTSTHIDALAAFFVMKPHVLDVIVASNLFGDILTDLGGAIMGSIGIAPAANLNVERKYPSMFEPVHGSAPDIAGKGIANPIGQIWTGKLMLDFLGYEDLGALILAAIEGTLSANVKTADLGGESTTQEVTDKGHRACETDGEFAVVAVICLPKDGNVFNVTVAPLPGLQEAAAEIFENNVLNVESYKGQSGSK